ncbi:MAG TPA: MotA/TolQ/ExbB proton channel family protein [Flavitalea sp.]|nr:MotA/TolQ/ExbB proton channel family protein [Flavitalea sp.]
MSSATLQDAITALTNLMIYPVTILLVIGMAYALYAAGNMLVESFQRKSKPHPIDNLNEPDDALQRYQGIREWKRQMDLDAGASYWQLHDRTEAQLKKRINRVRTWVKLGPTLGLIGTLIPLGAALSSLANNNFKRLAESGTHSIGATVMGLAIGALCMIVVTHYERWYALDLAEVRHAIEKEENKQS